MSYVKPTKNGYYGYAYYRDKNGKRRQKSVGKFKFKRDALKEADKVEKELDTVNINLKDISFADYYNRWYETYKGNSSLADITKKRYLIFYKVIQNYFKNKKLRDVKRIEYQQFINWYGKDHAWKSVSKLNGAIRQCVSYAIDDDIIAKDFTHNVQLTHNKEKELKVEYLNNDEIKVLKKATIEGLNKNNTSRYMILTALYTGMRKEEIQALSWNDIDELHGTININKAWDDAKKDFKPTKTVKSKRIISVNRELLQYLDDLKSNNSTMIFKNVFGTIPTSTALNKCLRNIMKQSGISKQGFHFHSLRHVHVAYLISKGVDIYAISKRLGHSNVTITLNTYSYLIDEYKAKNDSLITAKLSEL
ncbi:tyrosine-type recombinase/integrase [uncultured Lactobacillus sp.]|uniref:tyrosine-type recombinase/integrase n=1 Tax=uncultured Lactobacillus sp. TaxID=153152 RepID=UPI0028052902|nr:tyrosine-type recombinase/integrase [uncultured Lactobacillus sp.]